MTPPFGRRQPRTVTGSCLNADTLIPPFLRASASGGRSQQRLTSKRTDVLGTRGTEPVLLLEKHPARALGLISVPAFDTVIIGDERLCDIIQAFVAGDDGHMEELPSAVLGCGPAIRGSPPPLTLERRPGSIPPADYHRQEDSRSDEVAKPGYGANHDDDEPEAHGASLSMVMRKPPRRRGRRALRCRIPSLHTSRPMSGSTSLRSGSFPAP